MDTPSVVERLRAAVQPAAAQVGLVVEDVELVRAGARSVVRVLLDLTEDDPGSLDLDRLGAATTLVSAALDGADALNGAYTLEVSSPGVHRPLTARRHFVHALGRQVQLRLVDGSAVIGRLDEVLADGPEGATLVVVPRSDPGKGRRPKDLPAVRLPLDRVREGRVEVDLTGLGPVHDEDGAHDDGAHDDGGAAGSSAAGRE